MMKKVTDLNDLINKVRKIFENEDEVDIEKVKQLLSSYKSDPKDWKKYCSFDRHRYTRNLVDTGNNKYNLLLLCWSEGQGSVIHDHANSHCFMKMLAGSLTETRFETPERIATEKNDEEFEAQEMKITRVRCLNKDEVEYINDSIGIHQMENHSHVEPAISLHLYIPQFKFARAFDQRTGRASLVECIINESETLHVSEENGMLKFHKLQ